MRDQLCPNCGQWNGNHTKQCPRYSQDDIPAPVPPAPDDLVRRLRDFGSAGNAVYGYTMCEAADRVEALAALAHKRDCEATYERARADRLELLREADARRVAELESHIHEMEITVPHSTIIGLRDELSKAERERDENYARVASLIYSEKASTLLASEIRRWRDDYINWKERAEKAERERDDAYSVIQYMMDHQGHYKAEHQAAIDKAREEAREEE